MCCFLPFSMCNKRGRENTVKNRSVRDDMGLSGSIESSSVFLLSVLLRMLFQSLSQFSYQFPVLTLLMLILFVHLSTCRSAMSSEPPETVSLFLLTKCASPTTLPRLFLQWKLLSVKRQPWCKRSLERSQQSQHPNLPRQLEQSLLGPCSKQSLYLGRVVH